MRLYIAISSSERNEFQLLYMAIPSKRKELQLSYQT